MADPLIIGGVISAVGKLLDRVLPDPQAKMDAKIKLAEMAQAGEFKELDLIAKQVEVNMKEAEHASVFVAGWRPYIGWTCGAGLSYQFVVQPLLSWLALLGDQPVPPPLDASTLLAIVVPLLGFGAYRTYERVNNKQRNVISTEG